MTPFGARRAPVPGSRTQIALHLLSPAQERDTCLAEILSSALMALHGCLELFPLTLPRLFQAAPPAAEAAGAGQGLTPGTNLLEQKNLTLQPG